MGSESDRTESLVPAPRVPPSRARCVPPGHLLRKPCSLSGSRSLLSGPGSLHSAATEPPTFPVARTPHTHCGPSFLLRSAHRVPPTVHRTELLRPQLWVGWGRMGCGGCAACCSLHFPPRSGCSRAGLPLNCQHWASHRPVSQLPFLRKVKAMARGRPRLRGSALEAALGCFASPRPGDQVSGPA